MDENVKKGVTTFIGQIFSKSLLNKNVIILHYRLKTSIETSYKIKICI